MAPRKGFIHDYRDRKKAGESGSPSAPSIPEEEIKYLVLRVLMLATAYAKANRSNPNWSREDPTDESARPGTPEPEWKGFDSKALEALEGLIRIVDDYWAVHASRQVDALVTETMVEDLAGIYRQVQEGYRVGRLPTDEEYLAQLVDWARRHHLRVDEKQLKLMALDDWAIRFDEERNNRGPARAAQASIGDYIGDVKYRTVHNLAKEQTEPRRLPLAFGQYATASDIANYFVRLLMLPPDVAKVLIDIGWFLDVHEHCHEDPAFLAWL
jgi:hypothetical protein